VTTVGQGESVSHLVVQIRDRESPHIHEFPDGTVVMIKGRGYLMMENRGMDLSVGDVVYISRGVVHYYVNSASEPTVAFVIFSPPFDGKDTIPVTAP
jgi:mannose-6-phosphate isomerase-like protein (cupin superfamily)